MIRDMALLGAVIVAVLYGELPQNVLFKLRFQMQDKSLIRACIP